MPCTTLCLPCTHLSLEASLFPGSLSCVHAWILHLHTGSSISATVAVCSLISVCVFLLHAAPATVCGAALHVSHLYTAASATPAPVICMYLLSHLPCMPWTSVWLLSCLSEPCCLPGVCLPADCLYTHTVLLSPLCTAALPILVLHTTAHTLPCLLPASVLHCFSLLFGFFLWVLCHTLETSWWRMLFLPCLYFSLCSLPLCTSLLRDLGFLPLF